MPSKSSSNPTTEEKVSPLTSGIPPWHSIAYLTTVLAVCIPFLPSLDDIDALSQPSVWASRKFPDIVSLENLAYCRLGIAGIALSLTLYLILFDPGWDVEPNYKPKSKLRRVTIRLQGIGTMCPFTSWCWLILGLGFLSRGILALAVAETTNKVSPPAWAVSVLENQIFSRATLILWELTGPNSILVSTAIKYSIWPQALKAGTPHKLSSFRNQLQHNCNCIFSLLEVTLLGGIPVQFSHISLAAVMGVVYITFTWIIARIYFGNATVGPQYIYWFLDTTLEETTTIALIALNFALLVYFAIFSVVVETVLGGSNLVDEEATPPSLALSVAFWLTGIFFGCKFKD